MIVSPSSRKCSVTPEGVYDVDIDAPSDCDMDQMPFALEPKDETMGGRDC